MELKAVTIECTDGGYIAIIMGVEMLDPNVYDGITGHGGTELEAMKELFTAMAGAFEVEIEDTEVDK